MAIRDDLEQPRYLQTVVGKGYRFVGPITVIASNGSGEMGMPMELGLPYLEPTFYFPFASLRSPNRPRRWCRAFDLGFPDLEDEYLWPTQSALESKSLSGMPITFDRLGVLMRRSSKPSVPASRILCPCGRPSWLVPLTPKNTMMRCAVRSSSHGTEPFRQLSPLFPG